jgi:hypothetical protein
MRQESRGRPARVPADYDGDGSSLCSLQEALPNLREGFTNALRENTDTLCWFTAARREFRVAYHGFALARREFARMLRLKTDARKLLLKTGR